MQAEGLHDPPDGDIEALANLLRGRRFAVLTGAGVSTESGIPDYRGPETRRRARNPIRFQQYLANPESRRHYWARSVIGWQRFRGVEPNGAHRALAALESRGLIEGVITQNVDRLHTAAGSRRVIELHGALAEVRCLDCGTMEPRDELQARLLAMNPGWLDRRAELAPDGDAELPPELTQHFRVAACIVCQGTLKPNVVFFGENVPKPVVDEAWRLYDGGEVLVVIGSSLAVFSGYRFVRRARKEGKPVAIVNLGESRGDADATLRIERRASEVLEGLASAMGLVGIDEAEVRP